MAKIKFGEGITLGMELPKEAPQAASQPEAPKQEDAPLRMPQISASEVADEVLSRIDIPEAKEVNLAPIQADISALKHRLQEQSNELDEIKVNQHHISALTHKINSLADKPDLPDVKSIIHHRDHSVELTEMDERIEHLKKCNLILSEELGKLKYACMALIIAVLITNLYNIL